MFLISHLYKYEESDICRSQLENVFVTPDRYESPSKLLDYSTGSEYLPCNFTKKSLVLMNNAGSYFVSNSRKNDIDMLNIY